MKKVLLVGPITTPLTGQSAAFHIVCNEFGNTESSVVNTTRFSDRKILSNIYAIICIFSKLVFGSYSKVYFTCSRTTLGFIRDLFLIVLSKRVGAELINHLHGADFYSFSENGNLIKRLLVKWAYSHVDISIVLIPGMAQEFRSYKRMKIEVISNCFESGDYVTDLNKKPGLNVLYFSNLMYSKGIMHFLEITEKVLAINQDISFVMAGALMADDYMSKLEIEREFYLKYHRLEQRFGDRILYLGPVSGREKIDLLRSSSIFILPTFYRSEAQPISIIEAMYYQCAILTTRHNYLESFVDDSMGGVFNVGDVDAFVSRILSLQQNRKLLASIALSNYRMAMSRYNQDVYISKLRRIFES